MKILLLNHFSRIGALSLTLGLVSLLACAAPVMAEPPFRVLIFSKTEGFRHDSIPTGIAVIQSLGNANGFTVDATEDAGAFTAQNLTQYAAVIWLCTTGDVLDAAQQTAFEQYMQAGGGYVGVHSASDTEYGWLWYGQLLGNDAWFQDHPAIQTATLHVEDGNDLSTAQWPAQFNFTDEWYNFQANPRPAVHVLVTIDESTYDPGPGAMGGDHPISWRHEFEGGRAWYTAMGHLDETYLDASFQQHLLGGILWTARIRLPGDLNCDRLLDFFDIDPFILALLDPGMYAAQYPDCDAGRADINNDGGVDFFDIDPFVACLLDKSCS